MERTSNATANGMPSEERGADKLTQTNACKFLAFCSFTQIIVRYECGLVAYKNLRRESANILDLSVQNGPNGCSTWDRDARIASFVIERMDSEQNWLDIWNFG